MKQLFLLLSLLTICSYSQSNDGVTMKISFKPQTRYLTEIKQMTSGTMEYIASENILQRLKEKGIANPTDIHTESKYKTILRNGKLNKNGNFPLTMLIIDNSGVFKTLPDDLVIYGHGTLSNLPVFDSIASKKVSKDYKKEFLTGIQAMFTQLSFPEKSSKVGESFVIDIPLNLPIAGKNIEMQINCIYTLDRIVNDIAEYSIITKYSLKSGLDSSMIQAKGSGLGKLEYDIKNNVNKKYEVSSELELTITMEQITIMSKMMIGQIITTLIENHN